MNEGLSTEAHKAHICANLSKLFGKWHLSFGTDHVVHAVAREPERGA